MEEPFVDFKAQLQSEIDRRRAEVDRIIEWVGKLDSMGFNWDVVTKKQAQIIWTTIEKEAQR